MISNENSTKSQYLGSQEDIIYVLVIDDEIDFASLIKQLLEVKSFGRLQVEIKFSAKKALELLERKHFDVIVSDYQMPEMDGLELLVELRRRGNNIPFIIFTAHSREDVVIQALNLGADFFLQKGEKIEILLTELLHFIIISTDLKKSEKSYQDFYENAPDMFVSVDVKTGNIIRCNLTLVTCLGYSKKELINHSVNEIYHPDCLEKAKRLFQFFKETGVIKDAELILKRKDGRKINVSLNVSAERDVLGNILNSRSILRDITKLKEVEKNLKESEKWFSTTLSSIGDAVIATDNLGKVLFLNPIAEVLTGFKREECIQKPLEDIFNIINEKTRKTVENPVSRVIQEGIIVGLANHTVLISKDGKEIPITDSGSPIKNDKGNVIGVVLIFRDITEIREAEEKLQERSDDLGRNLKDLQEKTHLSKILLDAMPNVAFIANSKREIVFNNQTATKLGAITGKNCFKTWGQRENPCTWCLSPKALTTGETQNRIIEEHGIVWDTYWIPIHSDLYLYYAFDITELKRVEEKFRESEEWLSTTLSSIGDAVIATDSLGNVLFVNPIAEDLTGFKREESISKPLEDIFNIINEKTRKSVESPLSKVIREGNIVGLANHTLLITKDGKEIPIADSGAPIRDDKGNIIGIVLIFRDITEIREIDLALKESEERLRRFMESATENFILFDSELNYIDLNKSFLKSFSEEVNKEDIIGKNILDINPNLKKNGRYDQYLDVIRTGEPLFIENLVPHSKFGNIILELKAFKVGTGLGLITTDVTRRKNQEDLLRQQKQELSEFAHQIVHDSRSQLLSIQGLAQLLMEKGENEFAPKIKLTSKKVLELHERTLELADAGLVAKKTEFIDLNDLVKKIAKNFLPGNIKFSTSDLLFVYCDRLKVIEIFQNLFENAINHGKANKIEVTSDQNLILIRNDGTPIPEDEKSQIFRRGFTTKQGNSGLGLSIVKKIVEAHKWTIILKSDKMTVFVINTDPQT